MKEVLVSVPGCNTSATESLLKQRPLRFRGTKEQFRRLVETRQSSELPRLPRSVTGFVRLRQLRSLRRLSVRVSFDVRVVKQRELVTLRSSFYPSRWNL